MILRLVAHFYSSLRCCSFYYTLFYVWDVYIWKLFWWKGPLHRRPHWQETIRNLVEFHWLYRGATDVFCTLHGTLWDGVSLLRCETCCRWLCRKVFIEGMGTVGSCCWKYFEEIYVIQYDFSWLVFDQKSRDAWLLLGSFWISDTFSISVALLGSGSSFLTLYLSKGDITGMFLSSTTVAFPSNPYRSTPESVSLLSPSGSVFTHCIFSAYFCSPLLTILLQLSFSESENL